MSVTRLVEIRDSIHASRGWRDCATPGEKVWIYDRWESMPGWYSFYDAVCHLIREGEGN